MRFTFFIFILLLTTSTLQSQAERVNRAFNESSVQKARKGIDYSKEVVEKEKKQEKNKPQTTDLSFLDPILKVIFWLIVILGIFFLVYWIIVEGPFKSVQNKKLGQVIIGTQPDSVEELINTDFETFLHDALNNREYAQAIRLYYLNILKSLSKQGLIKWKKDKTNGAYVRDLYPTNLYTSFKIITRHYENAWYNNQEFNAQMFEMVKPDFDNFINVIGR